MASLNNQVHSAQAESVRGNYGEPRSQCQQGLMANLDVEWNKSNPGVSRNPSDVAPHPSRVAVVRFREATSDDSGFDAAKLPAFATIPSPDAHPAENQQDDYHQFFEFGLAGMAILSGDKRWLCVNRAFCQIVGYDEVKLRENAWSALVHKDDRAEDYSHFGRFWRGEVDTLTALKRLVKPDGRIVHAHTRIGCIRDANGSVARFFIVILDVSSDVEYRNQLERLAYYDFLTGLPNRALFMDRLQMAFARAQREHTHFAICTLDLDGFKAVNDTLGHAAGDDLLAAVAKRLLQETRASDTVARLGGDEFALLLNRVESPEDFHDSLDRITGVFSRPFDITGGKVSISASLGATMHPTDGNEVAVLLRQADEAMYSAKRAGRNRSCLYRKASGIEA